MKNYVYTYDNYVFDLYGTLVDVLTDEESDAFWRKIAKILKGNSDEIKFEYKKLCSEKTDEAGKDGEFDLLDVFEKMLLNHDCKVDEKEFAWKFRKASLKREKLFPKVKSSLKDLRKRGKGVYLISNAQSCFTRKELDKLSLTSLFDGIVISSEVGYKKPSKAIFDIAFEKFGIDKEKSIFIGNDPIDDIQGAENAGIQTHFVSRSK